jgi:hypothetical protein
MVSWRNGEELANKSKPRVTTITFNVRETKFFTAVSFIFVGLDGLVG